MDLRVYEADAIATPPTAPASPSSGHPTNGNPLTAQNATEPGEWWFHQLSEEMRAVILEGGLTPDHNTLTQLRDAIKNIVKGGDYKASVRVASTANVAAITGLLTIDGITVVAGDRVLLKDQTTASQNGIYIAAAGAWSRSIDADDGTEFNGGAIIPVEEGTVHADTNWQITNDGVVTIGTTGLTFQQIGANVAGVQPGTISDYSGITVPAGYLACPLAQTNISRATYAALWGAIHKESAVTISIATPGVITWNAHPLVNGLPVVLSTTGALPTGLVAGTIYYVVGATANTFNLSATVGGAAINTTGSQSGVHTAVCAPWGVGDGSTTFGMPWFPADYAAVQASANFGTNHAGVVLAHTHTYNSGHNTGSSAGTGGGGVIADLTGYTTTGQSPAGGVANLAAGVRVLKCVKY